MLVSQHNETRWAIVVHLSKYNLVLFEPFLQHRLMNWMPTHNVSLNLDELFDRLLSFRDRARLVEVRDRVFDCRLEGATCPIAIAEILGVQKFTYQYLNVLGEVEKSHCHFQFAYINQNLSMFGYYFFFNTYKSIIHTWSKIYLFFFCFDNRLAGLRER